MNIGSKLMKFYYSSRGHILAMNQNVKVLIKQKKTQKNEIVIVYFSRNTQIMTVSMCGNCNFAEKIYLNFFIFFIILTFFPVTHLSTNREHRCLTSGSGRQRLYHCCYMNCILSYSHFEP